MKIKKVSDSIIFTMSDNYGMRLDSGQTAFIQRAVSEGKAYFYQEFSANKEFSVAHNNETGKIELWFKYLDTGREIVHEISTADYLSILNLLYIDFSQNRRIA